MQSQAANRSKTTVSFFLRLLFILGSNSRVLKMRDKKTMTLGELQQQLKEVERRVQEEEERSKVLQKLEEARRDQPKGWWEANIQELDLQELEELHAKYAELPTSLSNDLKRRS